MAALLVTASRPRKQAAGGDAPASRDIVEPGDSGTPLSPLTETTDSQQRKSGGAWYADPQRESAKSMGSVPGMTALLDATTRQLRGARAGR